MSNLKLFNFHLAPYAMIFINGKAKENAASAYVYYEGPEGSSADEAYDHTGSSIGTFMNDDRRRALESHVREEIMPKINAGLRYSPFLVTGVDYTNMAPHPHLVIKRRDNKPLEKEDLDEMQKKLETTIHKLNHPQAAAKLFYQPAQPAAEEPQQHQYNLRSRQR